ncbi:MAG: hypothetical protein A3A12_03980 [Candidatus Staskawiczbacteria bacterium RIFCSPLOWO2_01_FULL_43_17b]|nr:MAG: hypothetical protein A3A12_03980 [Candidatus Staskawiczbacteria bacterium RIFCSPLOWO2_01_FULL_43_17b]
MAERIYQKRVIFPENAQGEFLIQQINKLKISWPNLAEKIGIHERTLNDWRREEYSMPLDHLEKICKLSNSKLPNNITIKDPFSHLKDAGIRGGLASLKKYGRVGGDPEYQKKRWHEWWESNSKSIIKSHPIFQRHLIRKPTRSKLLAEFFGIMLGDGSISSASKNQLRITLNHQDDKEYISFVLATLEKLFRKKASIIKHKNSLASDICLSSTNAVEFLLRLGLKSGNKVKQQVDIPNWIKSNVEFQKACVRGLMDTDGCIFYECHNIKGKKYCYPRLTFVTASVPLRNSVFSILTDLKLDPKIENTRHVSIENKEKIAEYFKVIGSSNPKHSIF